MRNKAMHAMKIDENDQNGDQNDLLEEPVVLVSGLSLKRKIRSQNSSRVYSLRGKLRFSIEHCSFNSMKSLGFLNDGKL